MKPGGSLRFLKYPEPVVITKFKEPPHIGHGIIKPQNKL
jgi:hypothetical protein